MKSPRQLNKKQSDRISKKVVYAACLRPLPKWADRLLLKCGLAPTGISSLAFSLLLNRINQQKITSAIEKIVLGICARLDEKKAWESVNRDMLE
jgi:hypothetical protein